MKIYNDIREFGPVPSPVVTIGTFDGLHLGHKAVIRCIREYAQARGGESVILTFHPHPRKVLFPYEKSLRLLTSLNEKIHLMRQSDVDHLVILPFTKAFSEMSSEDFIRRYLVECIGAQLIVVGHDHHFGAGRGGSYETLAALSGELCFAVERVSARLAADVAVSSTKVRNALQTGDIAMANILLGHDYPLSGTVEKGEGLGRRIGFPTANIRPDEPLKLIPPDGVYAVNILQRGLHYAGMLSIGCRPTFGENQRTIEVNIFDFDRDIYGEELTLFFRARIRDEIRFAGPVELVKQLEADRREVLQILNHT